MRSISRPISRIGPLAEDPSRLRRLGNVHWGPLVASLALAVVGLVTIASASSELAVDYLPRQGLWLFVGGLALLVALVVDYHAIVDLAPIFYGIGLLLLILVLFIGHEAGGARSWLSFGPVGFQPSEPAKLATALMVTRYLAGIHRAHLTLADMARVGLLVAVPMVLIALERDLGGAAMLLPMLAGLLLVAGVRPRHLITAALLGVLAAGALWSFGMRPYQRDRISSFLAPESDPLGAGYQVRQSKIAVGSGQLLGRGYGQGTQSQLRFLPERHTDFIMAVLAEEWGFAGVAVVLSLYTLYISAVARIAMRSRDRTGILLVVALISPITFHVIYNTAMVIGLLPITGIPLPFLSYGGSFTLVNFVATGLMLNVDYRRYVNR